MNDTQTPVRDVRAGDRIEHDLMPGFAMTVREVKACEPAGARPMEHDQYLVTDPGGSDDWLCGYDCHLAAS